MPIEFCCDCCYRTISDDESESVNETWNGQLDGFCYYCAVCRCDSPVDGYPCMRRQQFLSSRASSPRPPITYKSPPPKSPKVEYKSDSFFDSPKPKFKKSGGFDL